MGHLVDLSANSNEIRVDLNFVYPSLLATEYGIRLENTSPVIYTDGINEKSKKTIKRGNVVIGEGARPEIYTEEHEKLLGNTDRSWTCFVDGYEKDGKRIYDLFKGRKRWDIVHSAVNETWFKDNSVEITGPALFVAGFATAVCVGIIKDGFQLPTGPICRRIAALGFKSVAHHLVQTKRSQTNKAMTFVGG
ncbi:PREDICTED: uncharacterized protein LOC104719956 [Camelina sativa]|uniref:Uncharacterized protein LOC104719956 n=1 Tax=Camelina sativa TaxID=90675 RepID=A0ABM0U5Q6_CAMSA|nr:PREDICTED: uncharacterized protein LOC104719956 [Camelina sativa]